METRFTLLIYTLYLFPFLLLHLSISSIFPPISILSLFISTSYSYPSPVSIHIHRLYPLIPISIPISPHLDSYPYPTHAHYSHVPFTSFLATFSGTIAMPASTVIPHTAMRVCTLRLTFRSYYTSFLLPFPQPHPRVVHAHYRKLEFQSAREPLTNMLLILELLTSQNPVVPFLKLLAYKVKMDSFCHHK